jgi:predicted ATPase
MSVFKLIAIRPLKDCDNRFSKNLVKGKIYKFYQEYDFYDKYDKIIDNNNFLINLFEDKVENVEVSSVKKNITVPINLYTNTTSEIEINISAIVGKNGSGKSTLLELLYAVCYVIASQKGIIQNHNDLSDLIDSKGINKNELINKINDIQSVYYDLKVELFYQVDDEILSVRFEDFSLTHKIFNSEHNNFSKDGYFDSTDFSRKFSYVYDKLFFYTISINYSLYGLNTENNGDWLFDLFHKNDGYQTPLVINPYREKGNININTEYHLAQSRLFTNIVNENFKLKSPVNNKTIDVILFTLDYSKFNTLGILNIDNVIDQFKSEYELSDESFFVNVYNSLYRNKEYRINKINLEKIKNFDIISKYIYRKVFKIAMNYDEYNEYFEIPNNDKPIPKIRSFFKHLLKLQDDKSHITLKLRQILNAIRFDILAEDNINKWKVEEDSYENKSNKIKKYYFRIEIDNFIKRIKKIKEEHSYFEIKELIPASCYIPKLGIKNNGSISNFEDLSSGEQQFIHSIQSIFYHISNLNSVFFSKNEKIKYNYINLILDEIELYYHPEFQRKFLSDLLEGIKNLKLEHIKGINILFSTHSPFILSDIPHQNILKLNDGEPMEYDSSNKTFGSNIHELLATDFYLNHGFMGEFAKTKIQSLIEFLDKDKRPSNEEWDADNVEKFIKIIGEPILKDGLRSLSIKKYNDTYLIQKEIDRLQNLLKK